MFPVGYQNTRQNRNELFFSRSKGQLLSKSVRTHIRLHLFYNSALYFNGTVRLKFSDFLNQESYSSNQPMFLSCKLILDLGFSSLGCDLLKWLGFKKKMFYNQQGACNSSLPKNHNSGLFRYEWALIAKGIERLKKPRIKSDYFPVFPSNWIYLVGRKNWLFHCTPATSKPARTNVLKELNTDCALLTSSWVISYEKVRTFQD